MLAQRRTDPPPLVLSSRSLLLVYSARDENDEQKNRNAKNARNIHFSAHDIDTTPRRVTATSGRPHASTDQSAEVADPTHDFHRRSPRSLPAGSAARRSGPPRRLAHINDRTQPCGRAGMAQQPTQRPSASQDPPPAPRPRARLSMRAHVKHTFLSHDTRDRTTPPPLHGGWSIVPHLSCCS